MTEYLNEPTGLVKVLMRRDSMTRQEAEEAVSEARERVMEQAIDPEELLYEEFGLEPDYIFDLLLYN